MDFQASGFEVPTCIVKLTQASAEGLVEDTAYRKPEHITDMSAAAYPMLCRIGVIQPCQCLPFFRSADTTNFKYVLHEILFNKAEGIGTVRFCRVATS